MRCSLVRHGAVRSGVSASAAALWCHRRCVYLLPVRQRGGVTTHPAGMLFSLWLVDGGEHAEPPT